MRPVARLLLAAVLASLPVGFALVSCGTDAQNIEACRQIESVRCDLAPACTAGFDVAACKRFYRDACLLGTGNPDAGDLNTLAPPCIAALQACGTGAAEAGTGVGCPGQTLRTGATCQMLNATLVDGGPVYVELELTPCNIIMHCPEVLEACAWVAAPDAGADADGSDGDTDGGDAGTGGGTGSTGSTGGSTGMGTGGTGTGGKSGSGGSGGG
ncbi:Hypothetical protein A7982_01557 [Minicystis rosea]|nr:Hypothetical protein A7982_01557 [Minicystis rosea]